VIRREKKHDKEMERRNERSCPSSFLISPETSSASLRAPRAALRTLRERPASPPYSPFPPASIPCPFLLSRSDPRPQSPRPSLLDSSLRSESRSSESIPTRRVLVRQEETTTKPKEAREADSGTEGRLGGVDLVPERKKHRAGSSDARPGGVVVRAHVPHHARKVRVHVDDGVWRCNVLDRHGGVVGVGVEVVKGCWWW